MCVFTAAAVGAASAAGASATAASSIGTFMSIAQAGLGIMGAMASRQAQMAEYNEQVRFKMEQAKQAQETLNQQVAQQQQAIQSDLGKVQGEGAEVSIDAYSAQSRAAAAAAESGIVGLSVDNLIGSVEGKKGRYLNRMSYNANMGQANAENSLKMAQRGAQSTVASIPNPTKPSFAPTLVSIGSSIVGGIGGAYKYGGFSSSGSTSNPLNAHHVLPV